RRISCIKFAVSKATQSELDACCANCLSRSVRGPMKLSRRQTMTIEAGAKIQTTSAPNRWPAVWTVERVFDASDGRPHAIIVNASDPSQRKTLSFAALMQDGGYEMVGL